MDNFNCFTCKLVVMGFEIGNTFGKGRPKNSKNRTSENVRKKFLELVQNNVEQIEQDLATLKPLERLQVIIQLSKFVLPNLKQSIDLEVSEKIINVISLGNGENPNSN